MTVLITGGAGFIGSNFVLDWFKLNNEPVINLDKLTYAGNLANLASLSANIDHVFVNADINEFELVSHLLREYKVRAIAHFAAESHVDRSIESPDEFIQTNIVGTYRLLEAARGYWNELSGSAKEAFRFLHISTDEVYGSLSPDAPPFTEMNSYKPNSPYSASKAASDHLVRAYYHTYGLPVLTTHCSNNYGPYQHPEKLIPLSIQNALFGKSLPIYGTGQQIRDWLYVSDHCAAIRTVLAHGRLGQVYNVGGCCEKTNNEVVKTICAILDELIPKKDGSSYNSQISYVPDRAGHDQRYAVDAAKMASELDWTPVETFESGILKTIQWYLSRQDK